MLHQRWSRHRVVVLAVLVLGSLLLAACGDDGADDPLPTLAVFPTAESLDLVVTATADDTTAEPAETEPAETEPAATEPVETEPAPIIGEAAQQTAEAVDAATDEPEPTETSPTARPTRAAATTAPTESSAATAEAAGDDGLPPLPTEEAGDGLGDLGLGEEAGSAVFEVDENLTALEAYDAILPEIEEAVGDAPLVLISGSRDLGWRVTFYQEDDDLLIAYNVRPDGLVVHLPDAPPEFPEQMISFERTDIEVDSDEAEAVAAENGLEIGEGPGGAPLMFLQADPLGTVVWLVTSTLSPGAVTVDAVSG